MRQRIDHSFIRTLQRGFTLIELLVVISIIALLLSVIMPALRKAKERAKDVVCSSRLSQQGIMFWAYATENHGRFPPHDNVFSHYVKSPNGSNIPELLDVYANKPEIFYCPLSTIISEKSFGGPGSEYAPWQYHNTQGNRYVMIGYYWYVNYRAGTSAKPTFYNGFKWITKTSDASSGGVLGADQVHIYPPYLPSGENRKPLDWEFRSEDRARNFTEYLRTGVWMGHPYTVGGINVLFGDGSVTRHHWQEVKVRFVLNLELLYY